MKLKLISSLNHLQKPRKLKENPTDLLFFSVFRIFHLGRFSFASQPGVWTIVYFGFLRNGPMKQFLKPQATFSKSDYKQFDPLQTYKKFKYFLRCRTKQFFRLRFISLADSFSEKEYFVQCRYKESLLVIFFVDVF